jgi:RNA polymerase sigma-54 factor
VTDGDDKKQGFLDNVPARQGSLVDHVKEQLAFRRVPALLSDAVVRLVEHLDDRGLLPVAPEDLAASLDVPAELLNEAHAVLCTLEPRGIGARDAIEAMLLQAESDPDLPVIERMLRLHLDDLGKNRLPDVARALELSIDELQQLMQRVATLNPRPAAAFHEADGMPVRPDAYVWLHNGAVQATLDDEALPDLFVNEQYAALAGDRRTEREVRDYLRPDGSRGRATGAGTDASRVAPFPSWPKPPKPQQKSAPSVVTPHVWSAPADSRSNRSAPPSGAATGAGSVTAVLAASTPRRP